MILPFLKYMCILTQGVCDVISMKPKKKPKISLLNFDDSKLPSATIVVDISKKRTYRKKVGLCKITFQISPILE